MKKIYLILFAMTGLSFAANGQSIGDYRSAASGSWNDAANWERFNGSWIAAPSAPTSSDGVITILTGHTITVNSAVAADQVVVNAGGILSQESDLSLDNGTGNDLSVNGTWNFSNGTIGGAGNAVVQAAGTVNFTSAAFVFISATLTNNGTMNWQNGAIFFGAAVTMTNNGTINMSSDGSIQNNPGPGTFINNGTLTKTSTGSNTTSLSSISNSGTINMNAGMIDCNNDFTNTGSFIFNSGNWTQSQGTFLHNSGTGISGTGSFTIGSNATLDVNVDLVFPSTLAFSSTGTLTGAGNLTINNDFTIGGNIGGIGTLTINANTTWNTGSLNRALIIPATRTLTLATASSKSIGAPVTINGTMNWQEGSIFFDAAVTLTNNGTMSISSDGTIQNNAGSGTLVNNGTVTKTSAGFNITSLTNINNSGTINVNAGTIDCNNNFTNTGTLAFNTGSWIQTSGIFSNNAGSIINGTGSFTNESVATLDLNSNLIFPSTIIFSNIGTIGGAGNLTINNDFTIGGNIGGAGTLTVNANTTWNGGSIGRALIIPATRTLTLATGGNKVIGAPITNSGTINWQEGVLSFEVAATLTNNGTMNISGNDPFQNNPGSGTFTNNGTVNKTSTGTTSFALTTINNNTGATIKGLGSMDINVTTFNNDGFVAPGLSPGLLTINAAQPLSAGSTLNIEMQDGSGAGTGHDQLQRNGDITLAGTLTVTETGAVPSGIYTIIDLSSGTVSGSFASTNLPSGYVLQVNASNVRVAKNISLPLHLISFTAQKTSDNKISLKWVTVDEQNFSHFEIQRSADGSNYTSLATVQALNNPLGGTYNYRDEIPLPNNNYYRLRMVDIDASYQHSPVRKISIDKENHSLVLYPNPATDFILVDFSSGEKKIQVNLFDAYGKLLLTQQMNNELLIKIPLQSLAAGTYFLQISDGKQKTSGLFIKQ